MGSDTAGDVVALGNAVVGVQLSERVTNTYFRDWAGGTPTRAQIDARPGAKVSGVPADYVALDDTAIMPIPNDYSYEQVAADS